MKIREYLEKTQKIALWSFSSALAHKRLGHAYILVGENGTPLYETAMFLAKSILCDNGDPLADETCRTCDRIERGNYPDLVVLDGTKGSLKKEDVTELVGDFRKTPLEKKGIMVYVIHHVEAMTPEAENSLLKFLEEPSDNTYAILTTANVAKILPTILSRAETLRLNLPDRKLVYGEAVKLGVKPEDAFLLAPLEGTGELVRSTAESDDYQNAKAALYLFIDEDKKENSDFPTLFAGKIDGLLKSSGSAILFLNLLEWEGRHALYSRLRRDLPVTAYQVYRGLAGKSDPIALFTALGVSRKLIDAGGSTGLALDALAYNLAYGK